MGSITDFLEWELLCHVFGVAASTPDANLYIALSTTGPNDDGSNFTEPGSNYARDLCNDWDVASSGSPRSIQNTNDIEFVQATGAWGTITHYAIFDAVTSGNMLAHGALSASKSIVSGNTATIAAGEIDVSFNAGAIFDFLTAELLDHVFGNGAYSQPTIEVGLSTTTPADDGTNITEPSSSDNYDRVAHSSWATESSSGSSAGVLANNGTITFPTPSASWGTITYCVIFDDADNPLFYGTVENQEPTSGDTVQFADAALQISLM